VLQLFLRRLLHTLPHPVLGREHALHEPRGLLRIGERRGLQCFVHIGTNLQHVGKEGGERFFSRLATLQPPVNLADLDAGFVRGLRDESVHSELLQELLCQIVRVVAVPAHPYLYVSRCYWSRARGGRLFQNAADSARRRVLFFPHIAL
jgi:hypothetical protein